MPDVLRRLNLSPRALVLAGAAIVAFVLWRRGAGGGGGSGVIEGPLTSIPPGTADETLGGGTGDVAQIYALPPTGGIIHIPGEDPIIIEPTPRPQPVPAPGSAGAPKFLYRFGHYWRQSQLPTFYAAWKRQHRGADTQAAWRNYLRQHPGVASFFGLPVPAAPAASTAAAAPAPQPSTAQASVAGSPPNTARAKAPVPKPRHNPDAVGQQVVETVSGARVVMPPYALRGVRSPHWRDEHLIIRGAFPGRGLGWLLAGAFPGRGLGWRRDVHDPDPFPGRRSSAPGLGYGRPWWESVDSDPIVRSVVLLGGDARPSAPAAKVGA